METLPKGTVYTGGRRGGRAALFLVGDGVRNGNARDPEERGWKNGELKKNLPGRTAGEGGLRRKKKDVLPRDSKKSPQRRKKEVEALSGGTCQSLGATPSLAHRQKSENADLQVKKKYFCILHQATTIWRKLQAGKLISTELGGTDPSRSIEKNGRHIGSRKVACRSRGKKSCKKNKFLWGSIF